MDGPDPAAKTPTARPIYRPGPSVPPPRHTLPWWRRFERRSYLSVVKRVASPRARRVAARVPLFDILSRRLLRRVDRLQVTVCGAPFRLDVIRRSVSRSVFLGGRWHSPVVAILREQVRPGMTAVDVGANVGFMAAHMGDRAGPEGTVIAFEPEPRNFRLLSVNARNARWRNIVPINAAIGDRVGRTRLYLSPSDGGDHRTVAVGPDRPSIDVAATTIDAVAEERRTEIHFAKLDIQGAEGVAIRGMRKTLASPAFRGLVLEFWPDALLRAGEEPREVLDRIRQGGLRCASDSGLDADPAAFLAAIPAHASQDILFLRP